jgi:hypothetical protein
MCFRLCMALGSGCRIPKNPSQVLYAVPKGLSQAHIKQNAIQEYVSRPGKALRRQSSSHLQQSKATCIQEISLRAKSLELDKFPLSYIQSRRFWRLARQVIARAAPPPKDTVGRLTVMRSERLMIPRLSSSG